MLKRVMLSLLVVAVISGVATADLFEDGGNRLLDLQNYDGGWDWKLDDGDPSTGSASNTAAPIAMGLLAAYNQTGDATYLNKAIAAGDYIKSVSPPHSTGNGIFMNALSEVTGDSSYAEAVKTEYYDALAADSYDRDGTLYGTASYAQYIMDRRNASGIGNLAIWDIGLAAAGAAELGVEQEDLTDWADAIIAGLTDWEGDYSTGGSSYSVIGLAGGIYGLASMGADLPGTFEGGSYLEDCASVEDLVDVLLSYQATDGGFAKYADYVYDAYTGVQPTAYAILALSAVDAEAYADEISLAGSWLAEVQLTTGGWGGSFAGLSDENNEVTGEALWAMDVVPTPSAILLGVIGLGMANWRLNRRQAA